jgi:hypothetical protein
METEREEIIIPHCGPRYSWGNQYTWGSSYKKKLIKPLGTIWFKVRKIIHRQTWKICAPILDALDVKRWKYSGGVRMVCGVCVKDELQRRTPRVSHWDRGKGAETDHPHIGEGAGAEVTGAYKALRMIGQGLVMATQRLCVVSDDKPGLPKPIGYGRPQLCVLNRLNRLRFILWGTW